MEDNLTKIFVRSKPFEILLSLYEKQNRRYAHEITRTLQITYAHVSKLLGILFEIGLIERKRQGRRFIITLTDKGKEVAKLLTQLQEVLG